MFSMIVKKANWKCLTLFQCTYCMQQQQCTFVWHKSHICINIVSNNDSSSNNI